MPGGFPYGLGVCNGTNYGAVTTLTRGTPVTPGNNIYGSYAELVASTTYDTSFVNLNILTSGSGGLNAAVALATGAAGSEKVIASELFLFRDSTAVCGVNWLLPINIPAGSRVAVASRTKGSTGTDYVHAIFFNGEFGQSKGFAGIDSLGFTAASTSGTLLAAPAAGVKGAYTQIIASTARDYIGLMACFALSVAANTVHYYVDIAIGAAGSEKIIIPDWGLFTDTSEQCQLDFISVNVPAGTRISARYACDLGNDFAILLYGIYA